MAISFDKALGVHQHTMGLRAQRAEILSSNLANADTPNYKARDLDFRKALDMATSGKGPKGIGMNTTNDRHIPGMQPPPIDAAYRVPTQPSVDGNTVDAQAEQGRFMENAMEYQASLQFLGRKFKGMRNALRGE